MTRLGAASEAARFAVFVASHSLRGALLKAGPALLRRWWARGSGAEDFLLAPQDLRIGDPAIGVDIYAGRFDFAGRTVTTRGRSPFELPAPSAKWAEGLHDFGWLRHLAALATPLSRANARALTLDWASHTRPGRGPAWKSHVAARRILSWTAHAPFLLDGADPETRRSFMRSLSQQARMLRRSRESEDGWPRLLASIAVVQVDLSLAGHGRLVSTSVRPLADELQRQILPDGGHVSRHPGVLIDVLLDLLPLRETFFARGLAPPEALLNAIDRMMPMLRFFRLGPGSFARFNGMGATPLAALAAVLAFDDVGGRPVRNAPHSGYQRLDGGGATVIIDAGPPPAPSTSGEAHAGCLSFELASGSALIVVNCGAPAGPDTDWRGAARATAAHSTLTVNDRSSCRFVAAGALAKLVGTSVMAGPRRVEVERRDEAEEAIVALAHDGYEAVSGMIHRRILALARDGGRLEGEDWLDSRSPRSERFAARFHLHPSVRIEGRGAGIVLHLADGQVWTFLSDSPFRIEPSVYLAEGDPERTRQIVIEGTSAETPLIRWCFERV